MHSTDPVAHLDNIRAIITPTFELLQKASSPTFYPELERDYEGFRGHLLVAQFSYDEPWGVWEMHPAGDELVYLLSGDTDFILRINGTDQRQRLNQPGQYVRVPKGVWHTAEPRAPTTALFITPGEGTRNEKEPVD